MADAAPPERLADQREVTLLLRLLVDRHGQVVQGEVASVEDDQDVEHWVRFRGVDGLPRAVHAALAGHPSHPE
jgi:hypothetical protein